MSTNAQVIIPRVISETDVTSNATFDTSGATEYNPANAPYAELDEVYVGTSLYRSLTDDNNDSPTDGELAEPATWLYIGEVNRFKMFDAFNSTQTENADSIVVTFDYVALKTAIALFNVDANNVTISVTSSRLAEPYVVTQNAIDRSGVTNWFTFFKIRRTQKTSFYFSDLPAFTDAVVTVTIEKTGGTAKCGNLVIGFPVDLGITLNEEMEPRLRDTSRYIEDEFERRTYLSRGSVRELDFKTKYLSAQHDAIYRYMEHLVSYPTAVIGLSKFSTSIVFGRIDSRLTPSAFKYGNGSFTVTGVQ